MNYFGISMAPIVLLSAAHAWGTGDPGAQARVHTPVAALSRRTDHIGRSKPQGRLWSGPDNPIILHDNRPRWLFRNTFGPDSAFG